MCDFVKEKHEITHNTKIVSYPDGSSRIVVSSLPIFREPGWENNKKPVTRTSTRKDGNADKMRARRRAKSRLRDLARANNLSVFVTFTLDQTKIDRYDVPQITKKLNVWLDNRVRRKGLCYVLVPELHKDGAVHYHGLCNDVLARVDSGHKTKHGRVVYNLPDWPYGFTTAVCIPQEEYSKTVSYVTKYITKSQDKIGGRWFYSGGSLVQPEIELSDMDFDDLDAPALPIPEAGVMVRCLELPPNKCSIRNKL